MSSDPFVHLHTASSYSLRHGTAHPAALVQRAAEYGMDALALTDRDGLYGAVKYVLACKAASIRPLLGVDLALPDGSRVTLLARGGSGWTSLCRLVSATHLSGERGEPITTYELLREHADGLVALLGPTSDVGRTTAVHRFDLAHAHLARWRECFHDLAVEVVHHRGRHDAFRAGRMLRLADEAQLPAVLTNVVRYLDPTDAPVADVLDAARALAPLERRRVERTTAEAYLKNGKEMAEIAEEICGPDRDAARRLLAGTRKLAERCVINPATDLRTGEPHLPEFDGNPCLALRDRCEKGLVRRGLTHRDVRRRLEHELQIIEGMGLPAYFLTVADVAELIRRHDIRCSIRGSGAGCLVNYLIGISEIDPLAHGLVMERFCSESRRGLPDIDLDVESARRLDAYQAIIQEYGEERCACVSMMETYRARGAIRDVAGAIGLPPHEIDQIAKAFPHIPAGQIRLAIQELPELKSSGLDQAALRVVFRLAERLDGLPRHIAMHPCGVVLSNASLLDRSPVERSLLGYPMSQFDKDDVEEMGLLKLDVLGVRMQSAMAHALDEIRRVENKEIDIDAVPCDDPATYELIQSTRTLGCFQIESPGQRELVGKLEPRTMHDLIIDISLFRPGPVNSDMVTPYLEARHGWKPPNYPHDKLVSILSETRGVVVFHEQVLGILHTMTGCEPTRAEEARRALDDPVGIEEVRVWFGKEAMANGYDTETVDRVWEIVAAFGAFGFCKAHAAAFALPTYQSAWLKTHHPAAFFSGLLTHDPGMYPKRVLLDDARRLGVPCLPLDVNASAEDWRVEPAPQGLVLRVPLSEVKGISEAEVDRVIVGRPYHSLPDFWHRARVSRPTVDRIIEVGGLDALYDIRAGGSRWRPRRITRRDLLAEASVLERATKGAAGAQLHLGFDEEPNPGGLPEMTDKERVRAELDVLGVDVSRHVLSFYTGLLDALGVVRANDLLSCRSDADVLVAGVKTSTQTPPVRSGQRVIFVTLDDATGPIDATFFESVQAECAATVFGSWLLVVRGRVRRTGTRGISLRATDCWDLSVLYQEWQAGGRAAVHTAMRRRQPAGTGSSKPPRRLWHASPGSSGG